MKPKKPATILVVDDEANIREAINLLLKDDYALVFAKDGKDAIKKFKEAPTDLVLLDVRLPEQDGIAVLEQIKGISEETDVIMLSGVITVDTAVAAMKSGAYDYITKPFDIAALQGLIAKALERKALARENTYLKTLLEKEFQFEKIVGKSQKIQHVFEIIKEVASSNSNILISGESGTGKELAAHAIHNQSPRKNKLFVAVNCAAIPENLLESELFGHEKGAFTGAHERQIGKFEIVEGGTLFLDEISLMPLSLQSKMLRVLQEREIERIGNHTPIPIDARIISATNTNLKEAVQKKLFREDLFYRINVIPIELPALRERQEDIPLLAEHFINKYNRKFNKKISGFSKAALALLENYSWPGNVRELENLIERLVVLGKKAEIAPEHLPLEISKGSIADETAINELTLKEATRSFESKFIKAALEKAGGSKSKAAKLLGIHRNTLLQIEKKTKEDQ